MHTFTSFVLFCLSRSLDQLHSGDVIFHQNGTVCKLASAQQLGWMFDVNCVILLGYQRA